MSKDYKEISKSTLEYRQKLSALIPGQFASADAAAQAAFENGVLGSKTKELIAFALAVNARCDGCIAAHARKLHVLGASRQEVAEALGVSIAMGGGPSVSSAADALRAFDQFAG
ncbi:MAG: carboxymuconolactone decarboxylase family protein [Desulfovibrio sp.]|jgi:AhpD family alkylhydroperoxidase|nr:carboxymuconolactone decarboxylase family protein [Desulfovibrio sp.]